MAKTPRISLTLEKSDQVLLQKVLTKLDLKSAGQLLQMMVSGDTKRLDWIMDGFKKVNDLY
jgi:hypothetical protein